MLAFVNPVSVDEHDQIPAAPRAYELPFLPPGHRPTGLLLPLAGRNDDFTVTRSALIDILLL